MSKEMGRLDSKIQQLKQELILIIEATGLDSQDTLRLSQKLDQLKSGFIYVKHSYKK
ncbi:aspartyl-phosphate phosphatase Spo0E family protein [Bacillus sp. B15-48]|uniref:aspartyl-phosphate phosphatase Spo0E family protein n=1 Tax=Bacillus sp. B15-48 TaxID=1548601 RepID=UPI00193F1B09|nr:aspartyl-phosphate phosphatase Spo0E family protein [Bacillus sp. B15-48]MBM4763209.1 Spo0E family sporulation regulatory protein-aspartic acid phosphatase [Bacillus sp. B15-48]